MEPYALLVVARTQSLAERLKGALDAEQYLVRWVPSATQSLSLTLHPSLLILDLPPSGGDRSVARLKRWFQVPLLEVPLHRPLAVLIARLPGGLASAGRGIRVEP